MATGVKFQTVYYPESDGKPIGETDWHRKAIIRLIELLERRYAGQKVYVSGDLLLYYEQGNPKKFVVPDVFVVKDLAPKDRRIFRTWIERKVPNAAIEVTSRKTRKKDTIEKPSLYAQLGIKEYFVFDPDSDYLDPPLQGYRLGRSGYRPIVPDTEGHLLCQELGIQLIFTETSGLQLRDAESDEVLLSDREAAAFSQEEAVQAKEAAVQAAKEAAHLAEQVRRLKAELAKRKPSK